MTSSTENKIDSFKQKKKKKNYTSYLDECLNVAYINEMIFQFST